MMQCERWITNWEMEERMKSAVQCRLGSCMYGKRKCGWKEWEHREDAGQAGKVEQSCLFPSVPIRNDFTAGRKPEHILYRCMHTHTHTHRQSEHLLSHFIPW